MYQLSGELHEDERISQPQAQPPAQSHSAPSNSSLSMQFQHDESGSLQQHAHQHNMGLGNPLTLTGYPDSYHGFNNPQTSPPLYNNPQTSPSPQYSYSDQESDISEQEEFPPASSGSASRLAFTKFVEDPPDLDNWRRKLFDLEEPVILTQQQYQTYFPWMDNVYSHRSTYTVQYRLCTYHYWDCRLKGRNTGYAKFKDPNKPKRQRCSRKGPQCSVMILISEYPTGAVLESAPTVLAWAVNNPSRMNRIAQIKSELAPCYIIGRANEETHQHTLERSDEIKKNSVLRWIEAREQVVEEDTKPSRWKATGPKPTQLLEANPRGLAPAIRHGDWTCGGSSVILEYLEDIAQTVLLLPTQARRKADCRLWIDFINATVVPSFYALLEAVGDTLPEAKQKLQAGLSLLVKAADEEGPYFMGQEMCVVDIHLAPFAVWFQRLPDRFGPKDWTTTNNTDKEYGRLRKWLRALTTNRHVRNTTSGEELYHHALDVVIQEYRGRLG
ncbi:putative glutathione transferase protein [Rhypophila sp. PSN 637]